MAVAELYPPPLPPPPPGGIEGESHTEGKWEGGCSGVVVASTQEE